MDTTTIAPVAPAPAAAPSNSKDSTQKKPKNKAGRNRTAGLPAPFPREAPPVSVEGLKPKHVSKNYTAEKNDPLLSNSDAIFDGGMGFTEIRQNLEFHIDFTGYFTLIGHSYQKLITADRALQKYISLGMYQYYAVMLLWRRLLQVTSTRDGRVMEYGGLREAVNEDLAVPADLGAYLNGIGNVRDHEDAQTWLKLQAYPSGLTVMGSRGTFGRVSAGTHWIYETLPAPAISVLKMMADIRYTEAPRAERPGLLEWALPPELHPRGEGVGLPTVSLLGWRKADLLTDFQIQLLAGAGFSGDLAEVQNLHNLPVSQTLLAGISGYLRGGKSPSLVASSTMTHGSLSIVPWSVKILDEDDVNPEAPGAVTPHRYITSKQSKGQSPTQMAVTLAASSVVYKYRFKRSDKSGTNLDGFCYRFNVAVPANWIANRDTAFLFGVGEGWNRARFGSAECDGDAVQRTYCDNVRSKTTRTEPSW